MMVVVAYDIMVADAKGPRRLRRIAKACQNYGQRVQNSLFECVVEPAQWTALKHRLLEIADLEKDSLRFYYLGSNFKKRIEHHGTKKVPDLSEPLIL